MKQITKILSLAVALTALASCSSTTGKYTINGNLPNDSFNGDKVFLYDYDTRTAIDSAVVADNKFTISGKVEGSQFCQVILKRYNSTIFITPGEFNYDPTTDDHFKTGELNLKYITMKEFTDSIRNSQKETYSKFKSGELSEQEANEIITKLNGEILDYMKQLYKENPDNAIGYFALVQSLLHLEDADFDQIIEGASEYILSKKNIQQNIKMKEATKNTAVGKKFVDFSAEQPDGTSLSLSDFVGKGKYTLVDFWASWCGPCIGEIKHIKDVYAKYSTDELTILGVATWDKPEDTEKAIAKIGIPWNHLMNAQDQPQLLYGIAGIPHIILFSPDGTIVARDLRGDGMKEELKKHLGK